MKGLIYPAFALVTLAAVSCTKVNSEVEGEVDFTLSASITGDVVSYLSSGSGIGNMDDSYGIRYVFEVWTTGDDAQRVYREQAIKGINEKSVSFDVRLYAKEYDFLVWADICHGDEVYYVTDSPAGLKGITIADRAALAGKEYADAYSCGKRVDLSLGGCSEPFTLTRPMGKIRLVSIDNDNVSTDAKLTPGQVTVTYNTESVHDGYNVLTGETSSVAQAGEYVSDAYAEPFEAAGSRYDNAYVLGVDYIFVGNGSNAYSFKVKTVAQDGTVLGEREVSNIPVAENKLTTVYGNFFSNEGEFSIEINDGFDGTNDIKIPDISVGSLQELKDALADADNERIEIAGTIDLNGETLTISRPVTISGGTVTDSNVPTSMLILNSEGVTIDGVDFDAGNMGDGSIIVPTKSGAVIRNCSFVGNYAADKSKTSRAIMPNASVAVVIEGCTFKNLRQPAYLQGEGSVITDNYVEGTKGFVVCQNYRMTLEGNTFNDNVVDIAIIANAQPDMEYYNDVVSLSLSNNGAFVQNQMDKVAAVGRFESVVNALSDANNTVINVLAGTYQVTSPLVVPNDKHLAGPADAASAKFNLPKTEGNSYIIKQLSGKVSNLTFIYDNLQRLPGTAWGSENPCAVQLYSGATLEGCMVKGFRNGVYANNQPGEQISLKECTFEANRTGVHFANAVNASVSDCRVLDNETIGILLMHMTAPSTTPVPSFSNIEFNGNWASDFENRWDCPYPVTLTGCTFTGNPDTPTMVQRGNSGEGSSSENISKPAGQTANIVYNFENNVKIQ